MPNFRDIPREPPEHLEIGSPEDWERIEEALGYKEADPERRERLCRDLLLISPSLLRVGGRLPEVRARNVDSALAVLRGHAAALQAYLWWGRTGKVESFEDLLKPPDNPADPPDDGLSELDGWAMFYNRIRLLASMRVKIEDKVEVVNLPSYESEIAVAVAPAHALGRFCSQNWQWLAGAVFIGPAPIICDMLYQLYGTCTGHPQLGSGKASGVSGFLQYTSSSFITHI